MNKYKRRSACSIKKYKERVQSLKKGLINNILYEWQFFDQKVFTYRQKGTNVLKITK